MSLSANKISNFLISAKIDLSQLSPTGLEQLLNIPIGFSNITSLDTMKGSYLPANDTKTILTINAANNPNFIIFICDAVSNLIVGSVSYVNSLPVKKVFIWTGVTQDLTYFNAITLDGRVGAPFGDMSQLTTVNWELIYGNATMS